MRLFVFLLAVGLSGCVAETMQKQKPRKGPIPEVGYVDPGGGELRYSIEGWRVVVGMRRRSALRLMKRICRGLEPQVTSEFTREDADVAYSSDELPANLERGLDHYKIAPYRHIVFECAAPEQP